MNSSLQKHIEQLEARNVFSTSHQNANEIKDVLQVRVEGSLQAVPSWRSLAGGRVCIPALRLPCVAFLSWSW